MSDPRTRHGRHWDLSMVQLCECKLVQWNWEFYRGAPITGFGFLSPLPRRLRSERPLDLSFSMVRGCAGSHREWTD